ncbi:carbohydrate sulfotransferase 8-like [Sander vitreus]
MKLPGALYCPLWFLLLLAAGSLLLLVRLQDLTDTPGVNVLVAPRWPVDKDDVQIVSSASLLELQDFKPPVTKRHRKLLLQTPNPSAAEDRHRKLLLQTPNPSAAEDRHRKLLLQTPNPSAAEDRHRKLLLQTPNPSAAEGRDGAEERRRQQLAETQASRRRQLNDVCAVYQPGVSEQRVSRHQVSRVYVEDRSQLLYCEVPKAGCSNWKRVLMVLGGKAASTRDIPHDAAHAANRLRRLDGYDAAGIAERLRSYTKVLFVREPFERLVSAFRDKFESPNSYYHPVFGRAIIARYRANASLGALRSGAGVSFPEFVRYLLDVRRPVGMDIHWTPVSQLCSPCLLRYSFIGKLESLEADANFLLRSVGAPGNLTFPDFKDRNPRAERTSAAITQAYFSQLSAAERQKVFDFFYMDYLMFQYDKPFSDLV